MKNTNTCDSIDIKNNILSEESVTHNTHSQETLLEEKLMIKVEPKIDIHEQVDIWNSNNKALNSTNYEFDFGYLKAEYEAIDVEQDLPKILSTEYIGKKFDITIQ
ncbi:hypothetical protein HHI36_001566 [Cryptolaemus montrouzieri]|uniref:Uncharacterized protein n=1 Tax=Cryptolaemus montrouzieri TaxID=559131 RepID=A0ABD2P8P8_9CUCU